MFVWLSPLHLCQANNWIKLWVKKWFIGVEEDSQGWKVSSRLQALIQVGWVLPLFGILNTRLSIISVNTKLFSFFTSCHIYVTNIHYVLTVDSYGDFFEGTATNKLKINIFSNMKCSHCTNMKCRHCINKIVAPWFLILTKEVKLPLHLVKNEVFMSPSNFLLLARWQKWSDLLLRVLKIIK